MAVLVTGGAGYIGSVTVRALLEADEEVVVLDDFSTGHVEVRDRLPDAQFVTGDFGDGVLLERLFAGGRFDAVFHFAALTLVEESMRRPEAYARVNLLGTLTLLERMRTAGVRHFVFSSSAATFGVAEKLPIDEAHSQRPINPYGWSKRAVEELLLFFERVGGPSFMALRYFNAAGASIDGELGEVHEPETHLIPNLLRAALHGAPFRLYGTDYPTADGTCERDFIHVEDLAGAHVLALRALRAGRPSNFFNLGCGRPYSIRATIEAARRVTGCAIPVAEEPRRAGDPAVLVASSERIRRELGWTPVRDDLGRIIGDAWRFLRRHPRGYS